MAKAKLGSGSRFKALVNKLKKEDKVQDAKSIAAAVGRKKYSDAKMNQMAAAGRRKKSK
jgi:hypothetical protein